MEEEKYLAHYGILRKSGRYPWGSGGTQSARNRMFLETIAELKKKGLSDAEIAKGFSTETHPFTTTTLRAAKTIALNQQKQEKINQAERLKEKGLSNVAIGERMGINESSVRALLAPGAKDKADILTSTANMLKREVEDKKFVDVGSGNENHIGVSANRLNASLALLKEQGYSVHPVKIKQVGTGLYTDTKVLVAPGVSQKEVWQNRNNIKLIGSHSPDMGRTHEIFQPPLSIKDNRIAVKYAKDGGDKADGVIYVRPGVKDISLGGSQYAQVRIAVNGTHYIKGMAVYKDDLPDGIDLVFNTNKNDTGKKLDAFKPMEKDATTGKVDPVNPFGAQLKRQIMSTDSKGKPKVVSAMNIVNEEGDWDRWSKTLSPQMLSKQTPELAKTQLNMTYERRRNEFDDIKALTNPAIKKKLLKSYSDDVDAAAVHLKAAAMPRQETKVLLPVKSVKDTEIYAPTFNNGDRVALIRFPHGGKFEIPELTVNNRNREARKLLGTNPKDAVGINSKVAERLSGADFDGDTVLVIPNNKGSLKSEPALEKLKGFDPRSAHPAYPGMKRISPSTMQTEMGNITNLIADMTIRGASNDELSRAVRHSMVIIDSEKHNLDYKGSAAQYGIKQLKAKYQIPYSDTKSSGASTLITRGPAKIKIDEKKPRKASEGGPIDPATGKLVFTPTNRTYVNKEGKVVKKKMGSKRLAEIDDAHKLSSGTEIERVYADHSNRLKALANSARKELLNTKDITYSPSANKVYAKEVQELNAALNVALKNRPLERNAQVLANAIVSAKRQAHPNMDKEDIKRIERQALAEARIRMGARKQRIEITPKQWEAIQAGAIRKTKLNDILDNAELDVVKKLATPRVNTVMTPAKQARADAMLNLGYTQAEVANALGVPLSTLKSSIA